MSELDQKTIFWLAESAGFIQGVASSLPHHDDKQKAYALAGALHNHVHGKLWPFPTVNGEPTGRQALADSAMTLDQVDEAFSMAWTDATHLPDSEEKEELCRRMRHAADYLDELRER